MSSPIFFFFQAEDGIRDVAVTGVQTCALPISRRTRAGGPHARLARHLLLRGQGSRGHRRAPPRRAWRAGGPEGDRKSVVKGKRVDLGGRRIIKKKKEASRGMRRTDK